MWLSYYFGKFLQSNPYHFDDDEQETDEFYYKSEKSKEIS